MKQNEKIGKLFNTEEEVGVRLLFILKLIKEKASLTRLLYYDYFALHLDDTDSNYESLHPSNPSHSTEIIVRRQLIKRAIECMSLKGLLDVKYTAHGIYYKRNNATSGFLSYFQSDYVKHLRKNIEIVDKRFCDFTDHRLDKYVAVNLGKWAGEFEKQYSLQLAEDKI